MTASAQHRPHRISSIVTLSWRQLRPDLGRAAAACALLAMMVFAATTVLTTVTTSFTYTVSVTVVGIAAGALTLVANLLALGVLALIGALTAACLMRAARTLSDGGRVAFGDFFRPANVRSISVVVVMALLFTSAPAAVVPAGPTTDVSTAVLSVCVGYLLMWTQPAVADGLGPFAAIAVSLRLCMRHPGWTLLVFLAVVALVIGGLILLVAGLLVTMPLAAVLLMNAYRSVGGRLPG